MGAEVSGSLRRTPSRPPRSALGLDRSSILAALCGGGGGPGAATARPARACGAAGRAACVGDARSSTLAALRGVGGGPGAAAARPACAHEAAGRAACVGDARSLLFSLLFAARPAAQSITTTSLAAGLAQAAGARLPRRPRAGADARGVAPELARAATRREAAAAAESGSGACTARRSFGDLRLCTLEVENVALLQTLLQTLLQLGC
eukprot:scaffold75246_cov52-Phaeocystis_antarctica.AAC.1